MPDRKDNFEIADAVDILEGASLQADSACGCSKFERQKTQAPIQFGRGLPTSHLHLFMPKLPPVRPPLHCIVPNTGGAPSTLTCTGGTQNFDDCQVEDDSDPITQICVP